MFILGKIRLLFVLNFLLSRKAPKQSDNVLLACAGKLGVVCSQRLAVISSKNISGFLIQTSWFSNVYALRRKREGKRQKEAGADCGPTAIISTPQNNHRSRARISAGHLTHHKRDLQACLYGQRKLPSDFHCAADTAA